MGELFSESKSVLAEYHAKVEELEKQEAQLHSDLVSLQEEMKDNLRQQDKAEFSEKVELKIGRKGMVTKVGIIEGVLEEIEGEKTALKVAYVLPLKEALNKDRQGLREYNANEIVEKYKYLMLTEITEIGQGMKRQYLAIAPEIMEIFEDSTVKEKYRNLYHAFNQDQYQPSFSWQGEVIWRNEVFSAVTGNLPRGLKQPKDN